MNISKNLLSFLLLAVLLLSGCKNSSNQKMVVGHLDGLSNDTLVYRTYSWDNKGSLLDTVVAVNGDFEFNYKADEPLYLLIFPAGGPKDGEYFMLPVVPDEQLVITGTLNEYTLSGGQFYKDMQEFLSNKPSIAPDRDSVANAISEFINSHLDSDYSMYLAPQTADMDSVISTLSERVQNGKMKGYIESLKAQEEKQKRREEAKAKVIVGAEAPDFTATLPDGFDFKFSSMRGKWVLLDFWGSWCHWCIKAIPDLKEIYSKYSGDIEFISIACFDTKEKWEKAREDAQMPWTQLLNQDSTDNDASALYAVQGYPSFYAIDPDGIIRAIFLGESDEFKEFFPKTFGQK